MTPQPLKGRKILVTAYDLEQSEHRGIAVYSKSLMRCLHEAGAEIWLLTEFFDKLSEKGLNRLPKNAQAMIAADRGTPHGEVVKMIDLIRINGLTSFAINIDPDNDPVVDDDLAEQDDEEKQSNPLNDTNGDQK